LFTDIRVIDSAGLLVTAGVRGEIQIFGPNMMKEYWNRPEVTADAKPGAARYPNSGRLVANRAF
jgi:fatty-acyl-CoA synthase